MSSITAFKVAELPAAQAVRAIRAGLPARAFDAVAAILDLSADELAKKLGVSLRTIRDQRKRAVRLSPEHTEKLVRIARIHQQARRLFTTDEAVAGWMASPAPALDGLKPIDLLDTDVGTREVEGLLLGLAHGHVM